MTKIIKCLLNGHKPSVEKTEFNLKLQCFLDPKLSCKND